MFGNPTTAVDEPAATTRSGLWSPAQLVAGVVGIAAIVFGALALNATGLDLDGLTSAHGSYAGFHHTPLLAVTEIAFGVLLLLAALQPVFGRALMALVGFAAFGLGIVVVADFWPVRMHEWLGGHARNGWMFSVAGGVVLTAAFLLPMFGTSATRTVVEERRIVDA